MLNFRKIEQVAQKISSILPDDPKILRKEFKNSTKPFLSAILKKADLVTRQEFEAQRNLLQQAESKLIELEARLKNFTE